MRSYRSSNSYKIGSRTFKIANSTSSSSNTSFSKPSSSNTVSNSNNMLSSSLNLLLSTMKTSKTFCSIRMRPWKCAPLYRLSDGDSPRLGRRRLLDKSFTLTVTTIFLTAKNRVAGTKSSTSFFFKAIIRSWSTLWLSSMPLEMSAWAEVICFKSLTWWKYWLGYSRKKMVILTWDRMLLELFKSFL